MQDPRLTPRHDSYRIHTPQPQEAKPNVELHTYLDGGPIGNVYLGNTIVVCFTELQAAEIAAAFTDLVARFNTYRAQIEQEGADK